MKSAFRKSVKLFWVALIVVILLLLLAFPVSASTGTNAQVPASPPFDIRTFLQWLIGGGGSILAVSWLLERMRWFQALSPNQKDYTIFGCAAVVGCTALAVVMYVPGKTLDALAPFFLIIASTFVTVFIAKLFHKADKAS